MKLILHILLVFTLLSGGGAFAQTESVDRLLAAETEAQEQLDTELDEFEQLRREYEALVAEIEGVRDNGTSMQVLGLRSQLRDAHSMAQELREAESRLTDARRTAVDTRDRLRGALVAEMREIQDLVADSEPTDRQIARMRELSVMLDEYAAEPLVFEPVPVEAILADLPDSPEELLAAADELADHAARVERQLDVLRERIEEEQARERVVNRAREFAVEEAFFEDSVSRRVPRRSRDGDSSPTGGEEADDRGEVAEDTPNAVEDEPVLAAGGETDQAGAPEPDSESGGAGGMEDPPDSFEGMEPGGFENDRGDGGEFGAGDDDFSLGGGSEDYDLGSPDQNPIADDSVSPSADPTLLRSESNDRGRDRRRGRSSVNELRAQEEALRQELDALRDEESRLVDEAERLLDDGWK